MEGSRGAGEDNDCHLTEALPTTAAKTAAPPGAIVEGHHDEGWQCSSQPSARARIDATTDEPASDPDCCPREYLGSDASRAEEEGRALEDNSEEGGGAREG